MNMEYFLTSSNSSRICNHRKKSLGFHMIWSISRSRRWGGEAGNRGDRIVLRGGREMPMIGYLIPVMLEICHLLKIKMQHRPQQQLP